MGMKFNQWPHRDQYSDFSFFISSWLKNWVFKHFQLQLFALILCRDIMNNKVFYQHPNLMRILGMHETVMEVMVNVLGGDKSQVLHIFCLYAHPQITVQDLVQGWESCCHFSVSIWDAQPQAERALMKTPGGPQWVVSPVWLSAAECWAGELRKAGLPMTRWVKVSVLWNVHQKQRHAAVLKVPGLHRNIKGSKLRDIQWMTGRYCIVVVDGHLWRIMTIKYFQVSSRIFC